MAQLHENGPTSERTDTGAALLGGGCELRVEGRGVAWPGVVRSVLGAGLYLAVLGLLAVGLGTLIRSTVGATAVVVGLVFVLPGIVGALPSSLAEAVTPYLPSDPGQALIARQGLPLLSPWMGFAVVCAYAAAALAAAAVLLRRRDA